MIDWNATAAMVQAVGSVGAIFVAIQVDRGASRRLRQEHERTKAEAVQARLTAIKNCGLALRAVAEEARHADFTKVTTFVITPRSRQARAAAEAALSYFLRQDLEVDAPLVVAMTLTEQRVAGAVDASQRLGRITERKSSNEVMSLHGRAAEDIDQILEEYRQGIL